MKSTTILSLARPIAAVIALAVTGTLWASRAIAQPTAASPAAEGVETLLRGPLHEGFAEPFQIDPQPSAVVAKKPPDPIEELPPEAKPAEEGVVWLPGYWAWEEAREDFVYVSGVWRVPPADRVWVPGYWTEVEGGYRWISGFWAPSQADEVDYLPYPPESLESGPTSPQPSPDHYWVSGCWVYRDARYAWRAGYWTLYREGWVWIPAHYIWTPCGVVFVDGYWDLPLPHRGVVFAPVCFSSPVYVRPHFHYTPSVVVDVSCLMLHLFVFPRHCHYYWGDYYDFPHHRPGCYAWHDYHGRHGYDPLFAYHHTYHRHHGVDYRERLEGWHDYFRRHEDHRPAHTWEAQAGLAVRAEHDAHLKQSLLGTSLAKAISDKHTRERFEPISEQRRESWADMAGQLRELGRDRIQVETRTTPEARTKLPPTGETPRPHVKLKVPDLPQFALSARQAAEERGSRRLEPPKPQIDAPNLPRLSESELSGPRVRQPELNPRTRWPSEMGTDLGRPEARGPKLLRPGVEVPGATQPKPKTDPEARSPLGGGRPRLDVDASKPSASGEPQVVPSVPRNMPPWRFERPNAPKPETARPKIELPNAGQPSDAVPRFNEPRTSPALRFGRPNVPRPELPQPAIKSPNAVQPSGPTPVPPTPRPAPQLRFERSEGLRLELPRPSGDRQGSLRAVQPRSAAELLHSLPRPSPDTPSSFRVQRSFEPAPRPQIDRSFRSGPEIARPMIEAPRRDFSAPNFGRSSSGPVAPRQDMPSRERGHRGRD